MENKRIQQLLEFLDQDPGDSFSRYALGLEYLRMNELESAQSIWNELLQRDPEYLATYYQLGNVKAELGDRVAALETYERGIECARRQQNSHTLSELQTARMNLLIGDDA